MTDDLNPTMKDRLENWRKKILQVKSADKVKNLSPLNYRQVRGDYGDDIRDFEKKQNEALAKELQNNPIYRGYR